MISRFEDLLQLHEVQHHAGLGVGFTAHGHLEHIVVAVPVGVIAFAEDAAVLLRRKRRIVIEVRGRKLNLAC